MAGLCAGCGKEECICRRYRKHIRQYLSEAARSLRGIPKRQIDPAVEFRAQTLDITEEINASITLVP